MIAQVFLTGLLACILLYAWTAYRKAPAVGLLSVVVALAALYFVWVPSHASALAHFVGIGRGADLIVYTWVLISLLVLVNLHLKLRAQMDLITLLARKLALATAEHDFGAPPIASNDAGQAPLPPERRRRNVAV